MKKLLIGLGLALFSYQALAVTTTTIAGIEFEELATLVSSVGAYNNNTTDPVSGDPSDSTSGYPNASTTSGPKPIGDGNGASYVMSGDETATLNLSFGTSYNTSAMDLTLLLIGNKYPHSGTITLSGGTSTFTDNFSIDSTSDTSNGYTQYNSVSPAVAESSDTPTVLAIYALTIPLGGGGTFTDVQLDISGYSAVPSLVGLTTAVVPVPAAVWLFGSGLIGLVGVARRKK